MPERGDPFLHFTDAVQSVGWASLFPALEELCQASVGHRLFSCSVFEIGPNGSGTAARIYTNDEASYPLSGLKEIVPNRWTQIVVEEHRPFVANTVGGFADVFPDHEKIASLGLGSVVNLPVLRCGQLVGTVNMLHEAGYYTDGRIAELDRLALPALLAFEYAGRPAT